MIFLLNYLLFVFTLQTAQYFFLTKSLRCKAQRWCLCTWASRAECNDLHMRCKGLDVRSECGDSGVQIDQLGVSIALLKVRVASVITTAYHCPRSCFAPKLEIVRKKKWHRIVLCSAKLRTLRLLCFSSTNLRIFHYCAQLRLVPLGIPSFRCWMRLVALRLRFIKNCVVSMRTSRYVTLRHRRRINRVCFLD